MRDRFVHIFPAPCERESCICLYQPPIRGRFVLYILVPAYCEGEICTHLYQLPVGERFELHVQVPAYGEKEIVHICTNLLKERDLHILVPAAGERERDVYGTNLYQLTVRERFIRICSGFL